MIFFTVNKMSPRPSLIPMSGDMDASGALASASIIASSLTSTHGDGSAAMSSNNGGLSGNSASGGASSYNTFTQGSSDTAMSASPQSTLTASTATSSSAKLTASKVTTKTASSTAAKQLGEPGRRAGACRVCLKSFKPDDFYKTCFECQQRVCDDCASYSKLDENEEAVSALAFKHVSSTSILQWSCNPS